MFDSKIAAKPKIVPVGPKPVTEVAPRHEAAEIELKIRERAHELYEKRGREPGGEDRDWLQAEHEVLAKSGK